MPNTVEITMTMRGFEVTMGGRVTRFPNVEAAVTYAQQRLQWAEELRELKRRVD